MDDKTKNKGDQPEPKDSQGKAGSESKVADLLRRMDRTKFPMQSDEPDSEPIVGKNRYAQFKPTRKSFGDIIMSSAVEPPEEESEKD